MSRRLLSFFNGNSWARFGVVPCSVALAVAIREMLNPVLHVIPPYTVIYIAILASALAAGLAGGLLATGLGALATVYLYAEPQGRWTPLSPEEIVPLLLFLAYGVLLSVILDALLRARRRLARSEERFRQAEKDLRSLSLFPMEDPNPVLRVSSAGELLFTNRLGQELLMKLGWQDGQPLPEPLNRAAENALRTQVSQAIELEDPSGRFFSFTLAPFPAEGYVNLYGRDMIEWMQAEKALRASEAKYRSLVENIPAITYSADPDHAHHGTYFSPQIESMLGIRAEECQADPALWLAAIHPDDRARVQEDIQTAIAYRTRFLTEYRLVARDGRVIWVRDEGQWVRDEQGRTICLQGVMLDITGIKQAEARLQAQARQLVAADRRKDEFLAMLAHELRNPLAPIRYAVQALRMSGYNDPVLIRHRNLIDRQVGYMARLLDDLLEISRITRGKIRLQQERLDWRVVVDQALENSQGTIQEHRHQLCYQRPPEPIEVNGDFVRLEQIVCNLLNNAVKYTEPGGRIEVSLSRELNGAGVEEAVLRVRDTGVGIAPEMLPRVFELFAQAEQSLDRSQGGLGIGLTMVQHLAQLHGGTVAAHSEGLGRGSEFTVRLPVADSTEETPAAPDDEPPEYAGRGLMINQRKVLVVDDNADSAFSLSEVLGMWGHQVCVAHDGLAALELAQTFMPDVVLMDIGLPGMDGYEAARRMRREDRLQGAVLVALTGYGQQEDRRQASEAGFDHHFTKPVNLKRLRELLGCDPAAARFRAV